MNKTTEEIRYNNTIKNLEFLYYRVPFKYNSKNESYELNINENIKVIRGDNYNNSLKTKEILNPYIQVNEDDECVLLNVQKVCGQERKYVPGVWEEEIDGYVKQINKDSKDNKQKILKKI